MPGLGFISHSKDKKTALHDLWGGLLLQMNLCFWLALLVFLINHALQCHCSLTPPEDCLNIAAQVIVDGD